MSFPAILTNAVAVARAAGFVQADNRTSIEQQPNQGTNRMFQVSGSALSEVNDWLGIPQNRRRSTVSIRVKYFRGGGDQGGALNGGDIYNVNARANWDMLTLAQWLTNPARYDAQNTGINRVIDPDWRRSINGDEYECWDLTVQVEWEANIDPRVAS